MHGYFLSLKLYTTARLIANPQSYSEYRDRLVAEKLASKSESRIRARRDQPKVNKALAERLRKAEEKEEALAARKKARHADNNAPEEEGEEEKGEKGASRAGLLADPRFSEIWQNPDFEVDEESREFALLNPATADNNAAKKVMAGNGSRKTAVEEEEDESDRGSSDDDEEDEDEGSEDSDDGG
jgi:ribosome biogenesis protein ENP2